MINFCLKINYPLFSDQSVSAILLNCSDLFFEKASKALRVQKSHAMKTTEYPNISD